MSDLALQYYNSIDTLDLQDLEILSAKISSLIFDKKKNEENTIESGINYFNSIKGTVKKEINIDKELSEALGDKYENIG